MPYPQNSHLKDIPIRHMATSSVFAEVAIAAGGEWIPSRLEKQLFRRDYAEQRGTFRRMARGIAPNDNTAIKLQGLFKGKCEIKKWRDHVFWKLLCKTPVEQKDIEALLLSVGDDVWQYIWKNEAPFYPPDVEYTRVEPELSVFTNIANVASLDAFIALIALARELMDHGMHTLSLLASLEAREIFTHVISKTPHLYICWKPLAYRLQGLFWERTCGVDPHPEDLIDFEEMEDEIWQLVRSASKEGISFPPRNILERHNRIIE